MARSGMWGDSLMDRLDHYDHFAGIGINGESLPSDANRLTLVDETDEVGLRRARIDYTPGENERAIEAHGVRTMQAIWAAAGAKDVFVLPRNAHTEGTCRMGDDAGEAVVDRDCRSFDVPNLWVCDNSVFPSSMIANPAVTIMALALRTAALFSASDERVTAETVTPLPVITAVEVIPARLPLTSLSVAVRRV